MTPAYFESRVCLADCSCWILVAASSRRPRERFGDPLAASIMSSVDVELGVERNRDNIRVRVRVSVRVRVRVRLRVTS